MPAATSFKDAASSPGWWFALARFVLIHLLCLGAIWTGVTWTDVAIVVGLYYARMFWTTAGYHRYFSHRTFKMGRVMQFITAFLAQTSAQRGVLWWASHHRHHHKFSDQPGDVHSVRQGGFFWAHVGWVFHPDWDATDMSRVKDFARFPELRFLDRFWLLPPVVLGALLFAIGGWKGLFVWFMWSQVLLWHGTFTINSLSHVYGSRRYETTDDSRNNWLLALITCGEGWHNNHHHYQASVNQGFFWWEIDMTYYGLRLMEKLRLVRDLRTPPEHVIHDRPHPVKAALQNFRRRTQEVREEALASIEELKLAAAEAAERVDASVEAWSAGWEASLEEVREEALARIEELKAAALKAHEDVRSRVDELSKSATACSDEIRAAVQAARAELEERLDGPTPLPSRA